MPEAKALDDDPAIRVLIVDDHKLFAEALTWVVRQRGMTVVGVAMNADQALDLARQERPDLVLMDLGLPGASGLVAGQRIVEELPETKVLAVTALSDPRTMRAAKDAGFHGFLTKDTPIERFADSILAVAQGQVVAPERLPPRPPRAASAAVRETALLGEHLTPREREVLILLASGATSQEVARRLSITRNTVRTHVQSILTKLQVHSRLEAVAFALRHGLLDDKREE